MATLNRYPGSMPFTLEHEGLFFGRDKDIHNLTTLINVEKISVLYGKSGLGKSSLLNAGVLPGLQKKNNTLIIPVRFSNYNEDGLQYPLDILEEKISQFSNQACFLEKIEAENITLWQHVKCMHTDEENPQNLLLVFDQFEELFTYPRGIAEVADSLSELLYNQMPKSFQRMLRMVSRRNPDLLTDEQWDFLDRPLNLKMVFSIRSDKMSLMDELSTHIPNILRNCYELKPLTRQQAEMAIVEPAKKAGAFNSPAFEYEPKALDAILNFLTQNDQRPIESFQLQILCQYIEENIVINDKKTFVKMKKIGDLAEIYRNYYGFSIKKTGSEEEQKLARIFIEEGLIFEEEQRRISLYEGQIERDYDISDNLLRKLVDTHLIRAEPHSSGGYTYELSHDTLVAPILKQKAQRQAEERKGKRRKKWKRFLMLFGIPIGLIFIAADISRKDGILEFFAGMIIGENHANEVFSSIRSKDWDEVFLGIIALVITVFIILSPLYVIHEIISGESLISKWKKRRKAKKKRKKRLLRKKEVKKTNA